MGRRVPQQNLEVIRSLLNFGTPISQIAMILGCSAENVRQLIKRYKIDQADMTQREFAAYINDEMVQGDYFGKKCPMTFTHLCDLAKRGIFLEFASRIVGLTQESVEEWFRESPEMARRYYAYEAMWVGTMVDKASQGPNVKPTDTRKILPLHPTTKEHFQPVQQDHSTQIVINGLVDRGAALPPRDVTPAIEGTFERLPPAQTKGD